MKFALTLLASLVVVAPSCANDDLLAKMGIKDLKVVKATEASQVTGKGFVVANGLSHNWFELLMIDRAFKSATGDASQNLELVGLKEVEGVTGATNQVSFDLSEATSESHNYQIQGNMTITSSTVVKGHAN